MKKPSQREEENLWAQEETDIPWRGRTGLLFKRDFLGHWQARYPDIMLLDSGYLTEAEGFDRMTFWVLEKAGGR